jgi:hypothetical protein
VKAMEQIICECCNEDTADYYHHSLTSKEGKKIIVCDHCYQEITLLTKINGAWFEIANLDGVEYFK